MKETPVLHLKKSTSETFEKDQIEATIVEYGNNFQILEDNLHASIKHLEELPSGKEFPRGFKLWNDIPRVGSPIGWVNLRSGAYAMPHKPNQEYRSGMLVTAVPDNEFYYECISNGKSPIKTKPFKNTNFPFYEVSNAQRWRPNRQYEVNDIAMATSGDETFYLEVKVAGKSGNGEPNWRNHANGTSVVDGGVTWKKVANPRWQRRKTSALFKPFGVIYEE